jgi:flagellar hook protein FlgE
MRIGKIVYSKINWRKKMDTTNKYHPINQETIEYTGRKNDVAINGEGFFIVVVPETGFRKYTRKGSFILTNEFGLAIESGEPIQGWNFDIETGEIDTEKEVETIKIVLKSEVDSPEIPSTKVLKDYRISENGLINGYFSDGTVQEIAQIAIAVPDNFSELEKRDSVFYFEIDGSEPLDIIVPGKNTKVRLYGGNLEEKNSNIAKELVNMMVIFKNQKK